MAWQTQEEIDAELKANNDPIRKAEKSWKGSVGRYGIRGEYLQNESTVNPRAGYTKPVNDYKKIDPRFAENYEAAMLDMKINNVKTSAEEVDGIIRGKFAQMGPNRLSEVLSGSADNIAVNPYLRKDPEVLTSKLLQSEQLASAEAADAISLNNGNSPIPASEGTVTAKNSSVVADAAKQEAENSQSKVRARGRKLQKLAEGSKGHLTEKTAPSMKSLGFEEELSNGFTNYSGLKSNKPLNWGKGAKMLLGGAVLGGVLMTMMSNGGHQSNEQLYGQQPVNR